VGRVRIAVAVRVGWIAQTDGPAASGRYESVPSCAGGISPAKGEGGGGEIRLGQSPLNAG